MSAAARTPAPLTIRRLATDSRAVRRGDTFLAWPGETQDGRRYIPQAIARGAANVLWDTAPGFRWRGGWRVPNRGVPQLRRRAGALANAVYDTPSERLWTIGITGTNGKTSCSQWLAQALTRAGQPCAAIGTLGYGAPGRLRPTPNTTPDAVWLHRTLAALERGGTQAVSLEVSSIGLDQDRVAGVAFDVALFTNLTRDHLDYHGTLARYRAAKARLFALPVLQTVVINTDDPFGRQLARRARARGIEVLAYGFRAGSQALAGSGLAADLKGVRFSVRTPWGRARIASPVLGRFNAANLLGVLGVLLASGIALRRSVRLLAGLTPVPGRMQMAGGGRRPLVVVDYAHTPDALAKALAALRELLPRGARLICVFGCGGDRDRGKRPLMGGIAARLADRVYVTSDNPRGEDPWAILLDIDRGIRRFREEVTFDPDRRRAIRCALADARRGDVVLIAGKGHESYQEIAGVRRAFSDFAIATAALKGVAA